MANKAINQLPNAANRTDDDWFYIVRSGADRKLQAINMAPQLLAAQTLIESADVRTLNSTPVVVVPAAPTGYVIVPMRGLIEFSGGSTNYAANTTLFIGSTTAMGSGTLHGSIADRSAAIAMGPQSTVTSSFINPEDSLSAKVDTGNPTTGDSDLTITVWYYLMSV